MIKKQNTRTRWHFFSHLTILVLPSQQASLHPPAFYCLSGLCAQTSLPPSPAALSWDIESFPSQERHINPPACSESAAGPLPGKSRNASHQMCWEATSSCFQFGGVVVLLLNPVSNGHPSCPSEEANFCPLVLIFLVTTQSSWP